MGLYDSRLMRSSGSTSFLIEGVEHPATEAMILNVAERNGTKGWGKEEGKGRDQAGVVKCQADQ